MGKTAYGQAEFCMLFIFFRAANKGGASTQARLHVNTEEPVKHIVEMFWGATQSHQVGSLLICVLYSQGLIQDFWLLGDNNIICLSIKSGATVLP